jgi:5-methylcytosine-specific restriction endonuclease McrA
MEKQCTKCNEVKSIDQFYKSKKDKYGVNSYCKECSNKYHKEYRNNNKDKLTKYQKEYYDNNKDILLKQQKEYRNNNKNKIAKYQKEYANNNKDRISKYHKEYSNNNKDRITKTKKEYYDNNKDYFKNYRKEYRKTEKGKLIHKLSNQNRRYKKKYNTNPGDILTKEQIEYLTEVYKQCAYCNTELSSNNTHIDHIHPLSKEGSHSIDNVVLACKECNLRKSSKPLDQWLKETGYNISIKHLVFMRLQET